MAPFHVDIQTALHAHEGRLLFHLEHHLAYHARRVLYPDLARRRQRWSRLTAQKDVQMSLDHPTSIHGTITGSLIPVPCGFGTWLALITALQQGLLYHS